MIVDWYVTTLIRTPGRAPADPLSCAPTLRQIEAGEVSQVAQKLADARRGDPRAQLFPEISVILMGYDQMRIGNTKLAVETMKLAVAAYPESADANDSLSDAYVADGQKELARQHAEKALALLRFRRRRFGSAARGDPRQRRGEAQRARRGPLTRARFRRFGTAPGSLVS